MIISCSFHKKQTIPACEYLWRKRKDEILTSINTIDKYYNHLRELVNASTKREYSYSSLIKLKRDAFCYHHGCFGTKNTYDRAIGRPETWHVEPSKVLLHMFANKCACYWNILNVFLPKLSYLKKTFYLIINNEYNITAFTILRGCLPYSNDQNILECHRTYGTYGSYYVWNHKNIEKHSLTTIL